MLLQLGGIEIDRAPLKKLRVAAATLGSFCRSIRRDGIDAIAARANYSPFIAMGLPRVRTACPEFGYDAK